MFGLRKSKYRVFVLVPNINSDILGLFIGFKLLKPLLIILRLPILLLFPLILSPIIHIFLNSLSHKLPHRSFQTQPRLLLLPILSIFAFGQGQILKHFDQHFVEFFVLQPRNVNEPALVKLFEQAKKVLQIVLVHVDKFLDAFCHLFVLELFFGLLVLLLRN